MTPFGIKLGLIAILISKHVSFSEEGPFLETLEFFELSHSSCQPFDFFFMKHCLRSIPFLYYKQPTGIQIDQ